jgi:hypothetical protein
MNIDVMSFTSSEFSPRGNCSDRLHTPENRLK